MSKSVRMARHLALAMLVLLCAVLPVQAAINALQLGARYDATAANIQFNVYSSRATRIELWIYKTASGAQPVVVDLAVVVAEHRPNTQCQAPAL